MIYLQNFLLGTLQEEEHEEIELTVKGRNLNEISDGLAGELYTEDGWIQKYTKQRYEEM